MRSAARQLHRGAHLLDCLLGTGSGPLAPSSGRPVSVMRIGVEAGMATAAAPDQQGAKENRARRDLLLSIQGQVQRLWAEEKVFEANAPAGAQRRAKEGRPEAVAAGFSGVAPHSSL